MIGLNEWIPYEYDDRSANPLPPDDRLVWVHDSYYYGVTVGRWLGQWWEASDGCDDLGVTHWMLLDTPNLPSGDPDRG